VGAGFEQYSSVLGAGRTIGAQDLKDAMLVAGTDIEQDESRSVANLDPVGAVTTILILCITLSNNSCGIVCFGNAYRFLCPNPARNAETTKTAAVYCIFSAQRISGFDLDIGRLVFYAHARTWRVRHVQVIEKILVWIPTYWKVFLIVAVELLVLLHDG
jgi:hypothetical protein